MCLAGRERVGRTHLRYYVVQLKLQIYIIR